MLFRDHIHTASLFCFILPRCFVIRHRISSLPSPLGTMMATTTGNRATKPAEAYENMSTATGAADLIKNSYSTALKGAQDYNNKLLEFAQSNSDTAFEFAQRLLRAESSSELIELSNAAR